MVDLCKETSFSILLGDPGTRDKTASIFMAKNVMAILVPDRHRLHTQRKHVTAASPNARQLSVRYRVCAHLVYSLGGEVTFLGLS